MSSSPSIYANRYNERFQSLVNSPPREPTTTPTLKNSPLRPTYKDDYKVFEGEKYTSYEIQNEDRGEWREQKVLNEKVAKSPEQQQQEKPEPPKETPVVAQQPEPTQEKPQVKRKVKKAVEKTVKTSARSIPKYMQATASFYNKAHSKKEPTRQADNVLRPRSQGGITKRTSPSKIPRRQPTTTTTNTTAKSPYVSMAARAKLFQQGLGNGSHSCAGNVSHTSPPPPTKSASPKTTSSSNTVPHYAQQTSISMIRQKELLKSRAAKPEIKRTQQKSKEPKPFHFATNERALRYNRQHKQVLNDIKNTTTTKGLKRKHQSSENSIRPNQKPKHT